MKKTLFLVVVAFGILISGYLLPSYASYECPVGYNLVYDAFANPQCEIRSYTGINYVGWYTVIAWDINGVYGSDWLILTTWLNTFGDQVDNSSFFTSYWSTQYWITNNTSVKISPSPLSKRAGFSTCVNVPSDWEYIVAWWADNYFRATVDSVPVILNQTSEIFSYRHYIMTPIFLTKGAHLIQYSYYDWWGGAMTAWWLIWPFSTWSMIDYNTKTPYSASTIKNFIYSQGTGMFTQERSGIPVVAPVLWTTNTLWKTSDEIGKNNIIGDGIWYSCPVWYIANIEKNICGDISCVKIERIAPIIVNDYSIEYYLSNTTGWYNQTGITQTLTGYSWSVVTWDILDYIWYTYNPSISNQTGVLVDSGLVLKLYYDSKTYTLFFEEDGWIEVGNQTWIAYNTTATKPTDPIKTGYTFWWWYTTTWLTIVYDFTTPITQDTIVYAKWTAVTSWWTGTGTPPWWGYTLPGTGSTTPTTGTVDPEVFNPSIGTSCFIPMNKPTIDQGIQVSEAFKIAHQMLYSYELTRRQGTKDYRPFSYLTREETARFMVEFAINVLCRKPNRAYTDNFNDIENANHTLIDYIKKSYEYDIFHGDQLDAESKTSTTFRPLDKISRDEIIATMVRLVTNKYNEDLWETWANRYKAFLNKHVTANLKSNSRGDIAVTIYDLYRNNSYHMENIGYVINR